MEHIDAERVGRFAAARSDDEAQDIAAAVLDETVEIVDDDITIVVVRHDGTAGTATGRQS